MALDTFFIFFVAVVTVCLLVYAAYRRYSGIPKSIPDTRIIEDPTDPLFNQTLSPEQIKALHRLLTSSA